MSSGTSDKLVDLFKTAEVPNTESYKCLEVPSSRRRACRKMSAITILDEFRAFIVLIKVSSRGSKLASA